MTYKSPFIEKILKINIKMFWKISFEAIHLLKEFNLNKKFNSKSLFKWKKEENKKLEKL